MAKRLDYTKEFISETPEALNNKIFQFIRHQRGTLECTKCAYFTYVDVCSNIIQYHAFLMFTQIEEKTEGISEPEGAVYSDNP